MILVGGRKTLTLMLFLESHNHYVRVDSPQKSVMTLFIILDNNIIFSTWNGAQQHPKHHFLSVNKIYVLIENGKYFSHFPYLFYLSISFTHHFDIILFLLRHSHSLMHEIQIVLRLIISQPHDRLAFDMSNRHSNNRKSKHKLTKTTLPDFFCFSRQ